MSYTAYNKKTKLNSLFYVFLLHPSNIPLYLTIPLLSKKTWLEHLFFEDFRNTLLFKTESDIQYLTKHQSDGHTYWTLYCQYEGDPSSFYRLLRTISDRRFNKLNRHIMPLQRNHDLFLGSFKRLYFIISNFRPLYVCSRTTEYRLLSCIRDEPRSNTNYSVY